MSVSPIRLQVIEVKSPTSDAAKENIKKISCEWRRLSDRLSLQDFFHPSREIFSNLSLMAGKVSDYMDDEKPVFWNKIYLCQKEEKSVALALVKETSTELDIRHLITHPYNVRCPTNEKQEEKVAGAASLIIKHLIDTLPSHLDKITVEAIETTVPFYQKNGFSIVTHPKRILLELKKKGAA